MWSSSANASKPAMRRAKVGSVAAAKDHLRRNHNKCVELNLRIIAYCVRRFGMDLLPCRSQMKVFVSPVSAEGDSYLFDCGCGSDNFKPHRPRAFRQGV